MVKKLALLGLAALLVSALSTNLAGARTETGCKAKCLQGLIDDLQDQVEALESQVVSLGDDMEAATGYVEYFDECLWVTPMTSYGDWQFGDFGYSYSGDGGQSYFLTSALDFTFEGDPVHAWVFYDNCEDYDTPLGERRSLKIPDPVPRSK